MTGATGMVMAKGKGVGKDMNMGTSMGMGTGTRTGTGMWSKWSCVDSCMQSGTMQMWLHSLD